MMKNIYFWWSWLGDNKEQIKIVAIFIAAIWTLILYYQADTESKIKLSLEYISRSRIDIVHNASSNLEEYWMSEEGIKELKQTPNKQWVDLGIKQIRNEKLEKDYRVLLQFYKDMSICSNNHVCDRKTLCMFFKKEVRSFVNLYGTFLTECWDETYPEINTFIQSCK